jgi:putative radical SAM enzyme (TIGR03279 family)
MSVIVNFVQKGSAADKAKIIAGDTLLSINGEEIIDVLDYRFYQNNSKLTLEIMGKNGKVKKVKIKKDEYEEIGLEFESYLMDKKHSCKNKCIFCFIDQLPKGLRETLYFKDDDSRLSFLHGNYVTLTNIDKKEVDRIIEMHLPVNISIHTTNPELRCKMMHNKFAGETLAYLQILKEGNININAQIVLCRDINDKKELEKWHRNAISRIFLIKNFIFLIWTVRFIWEELSLIMPSALSSVFARMEKRCCFLPITLRIPRIFILTDCKKGDFRLARARS